eukprot:5943428-Amphidinium_carterae.1
MASAAASKAAKPNADRLGTLWAEAYDGHGFKNRNELEIVPIAKKQCVPDTRRVPVVAPNRTAKKGKNIMMIAGWVSPPGSSATGSTAIVYLAPLDASSAVDSDGQCTASWAPWVEVGSGHDP